VISKKQGIKEFRMGVLINELFAFSKLERQEVERSINDMNKLTGDVHHEINSNSDHAEIKVGNFHSAKGDHSLLYMVMINLISNAIKCSSKKEKPMVEVNPTKGNGQLTYSIRDYGAGFDMHYVHKFFGTLQRLRSNNEFPGTWLDCRLSCELFKNTMVGNGQMLRLPKELSFISHFPADDYL
jgi:light-regulated signal transduction histidine kinase (bacteriophytochrome)